MNSYYRRAIISAIILLLIVVGIITFYYIRSNTRDNGRSEQALLEAITKEFPNFFNSEREPNIAIESVARYEDNWYVVTIKSTEQVENYVPVKVLLFDQKETDELSVILGPDVYFSKYQTLRFDLPDSVLNDLEKDMA